jgi:hypothetical protein
MINAKKDMEILRKGVEKSITPEIIVQEEVMGSQQESLLSLGTTIY